MRAGVKRPAGEGRSYGRKRKVLKRDKPIKDDMMERENNQWIS